MSSSNILLQCQGLFVLLALLCTSHLASAKPYFYFVDPASQPQQVEQAALKSITDATGSSNNAAAQQTTTGELPQRLQAHMNQLLSHGNSAVHSIVESIQPDIKNIGRDLTEVMHATRENVGKRIEPLANTAQKSVGPLFEQAREDIPKALTKVGEQVKGVWEKMKSSAAQQQPGATSGASYNTGNVLQEAQKVGSQIQQAISQQHTSAQ